MTAAIGILAAPRRGVEVDARAILAEIVDPEIPAISIVDLGIVRTVTVVDGTLEVEILPTFIGCPALDLIQAAVAERLEPLCADPASGIDRVRVTISFAEPWTAARISERGRAALTASGFAPPEAGPRLVQLGRPAACPYCGSRRTVLENAFGPTRCRTINYCTECRQPFEQFKEG
ncbi:MAG TPA: 1,2-phenylacetyl-CoA epoxidase subunit PaaD [Candidatus Limnocylindrales bacterium]